MIRVSLRYLTLGLSLFGGLVSAGWGADAPAFSPEDLEFFEKQVRPILVTHCTECHGPTKQKGGLRLDSRAAIVKGGETGPAVVPGKPDEGHLLDAIRYGDSFQMPPRGKLPAESIATLEQWVRRGAPWPVEQPRPEVNDPSQPFDPWQRTGHWSFRPRQLVEPPRVADRAWGATSIDRFIFAGLDAVGLKPNPPADPATLLRRLSFDLVGLPPSPEEVARFLDPKTDIEAAYIEQVDKLLDSERYGERWARHWLDLVRYAETCGHEFDFELPEAFEYRDYVIRALNADLPYDQFIVEHVAGDLLPNPRRHPREGFNESLIATGFYFLGEGKHSPVDLRVDECERIDNQLDVLGKAFLALTIGCARCHDHKFDPISARDYYALSGYLQSSRMTRTYADDPRERQALLAELDRYDQTAPRDWQESLPATDNIPRPRSRPADGLAIAHFEPGSFGSWWSTGEAFGSGATIAPRWALLPREGHTYRVTIPAGIVHSGAAAPQLRGTLRSPTFRIERPAIWYRLAGHGGSKINLVIDGFQHIRNPIYGGLTIPGQPAERFEWRRQDVSKWVGHMAYVELIDDGDGWIALDRIVQGDQPAADGSDPQLREEVLPANPELRAWLTGREALARRLIYGRRVMAIADGTPEDDRLLIRGNPKHPGEVVPRGFLEVLADPAWPTPATSSGRLELARQIASPRNPLTARVIVNRVWHHHFGVGLVPTVDDFGHMGQAPSHPQLLDALAESFIRDGWSLKRLHRQIVLSRTYRMSSGLRPDASVLDPQNRLIHRMNVRRLEAEIIRDALLAVSGSLKPAMYGPGVMPHLNEFMDGRGRPGRSGPLDGEGRRSIYLGVRRNFLNPFFLAFDYPVPFATMGRRTVSNVPAQALAMMNNPLVWQLASRWGESLHGGEGSLAARIEGAYVAALGRRPEPAELDAARAFLEADGTPTAARWSDLAQVLMNTKEFIYIP